MTDLNQLNYRPDFKRDEREKTGWQTPLPETTRLEDEDGQLDNGLPTSSLIEKYEKFKEEFNERIDEHEKNLEDIDLSEDEFVYKALEETGHVSKFRPIDFKELFAKKESSPGEYLIQVLEKRIEAEDGDLYWEVYSEYVEMLEELRILDYYIEKILYPIYGYSPENIDGLNRLKDAERDWRESNLSIRREKRKKHEEYRVALISNPDEIPKKRDELHQIEGKLLPFRQESNQIATSRVVIEDKLNSFEHILDRIDTILDINVDKEELIEDIIRLTEDENEVKKTLKDQILMLKQTIDSENNLKNDLKQTRRNLYSEEKQKRIINEYSTVNDLYRRNVLPSLHYMKSFQDTATSLLNDTFNQSAQSLMENHIENREKTYETYLIQISTSQMRAERLRYISNKEKSRQMFNHLYDIYKEIN